MKKQSDASSASPQPPEDLTFFLDRQLGRYKVASALRAVGLTVEIHDDHFSQSAPDTEWLAAAGENGWIVITRDDRIRYRVAEKQALRRARVRAFVLAARGDLRAEELAEIFLRALPKIRRTITEQQPPFIAKISRDANVTLVGL